MAQRQNLIRKNIFILVSGFSLIVTLLGIATKISLDNLNSINESFYNVVHQNNIKAFYINEMRDAIRERILLLNMAVHLDDPFAIEDLWEDYSAHAGRFIAAREKLNGMPLTSDQKQQLENQRNILREAQPVLDAVIEKLRQRDIDAAREDIIIAQNMNHSVTQDLKRMNDFQQQLAQDAVELSRQAMEKARVRILVTIILAVLLAAIILYFVIRLIIRQDKALSDLLNKLELANEDLEHKVTVRTQELLTAREENLRMSAELEVTHRLQQMLLPTETELQGVADLELAAAMSPADEVGGDYYDILQYDGRMIIGIGDVTGHGLESSVIMLMTQTAVRTLAVVGDKDPVRFVKTLNKVIYDNLKRIDSYRNLSFIMGHYDNGTLTLCGQHEELLLVRNNQQAIERIDTINMGFPLGLEEDIEAFLDTHQLHLEPGDTVVLYTDGIPEAENSAGEFYGIERLCDVIQKNIALSVQELHEKILTDLHSHISDHTIFDDITLVVIRRK